MCVGNECVGPSRALEISGLTICGLGKVLGAIRASSRLVPVASPWGPRGVPVGLPMAYPVGIPVPMQSPAIFQGIALSKTTLYASSRSLEIQL